MSEYAEATLVDLCILGIFEDAAQRDFLSALITREIERAGYGIIPTWRLTDGCNFAHLRDHTSFAAAFHGVVVGVDAQKRKREAKIKALTAKVPQLAEGSTLFSVASPSIEAWMMADEQAMRKALATEYGQNSLSNAARPPHPHSERRAKVVLADWVEELLGEPLLSGGREHAGDVGREVLHHRLASSRNPDLLELLTIHLPHFIQSCAQRRSET